MARGRSTQRDKWQGSDVKGDAHSLLPMTPHSSPACWYLVLVLVLMLMLELALALVLLLLLLLLLLCWPWGHGAFSINNVHKKAARPAD